MSAYDTTRVWIWLVLLVLIGAAIAVSQECTVIDFEEFEPNEVIVESQGVTFTPNEYRTYPADCTPQVDCPCDDDDLSFPGQGNILIQQEADSQCTPDDEMNGALFEITPPWTFDTVGGTMFDLEEGDTVRIYLDGQLVDEASYEGGDNEAVTWEADIVGDYMEFECNGTCALDDLIFCEAPIVPAMPWWVLGLTALLTLSGAAWWLGRRSDSLE